MTGHSAQAPADGWRLGAIITPVLTVAAAYGLWWVSDQLIVIGPLDRAAFGWLVVIPVWLAAPVVAGVAWRALDRRARLGSALAVGAIVGGAAALLWLRAVAGMDCTSGPTRSAGEWVLPSLALGGAIGAIPALGGLTAAPFMREGRVLAGVVMGSGAALLLTLLTIVVAGVLLLAGPGCQAPSA